MSTTPQQSFTEKESLQVITEMIQKVKTSFHERGSSAILWGAVIAVCGFVSFARLQWNLNLGFDIWLLTLVAVIPQIYFVIQERKTKMVKTYQQAATDIVWMVYVVSLVALIVYGNIVPSVSDKLLAEDGSSVLLKNNSAGTTEKFTMFIPSFSSLFLIIYAFPTMATGLINNFRPMIFGAVLCYIFFVISLFTINKYDLLLTGLAGIFNWLIPGFILRSKYIKSKQQQHV